MCNKIIGLDISKDFVEIAQRNAKEAGVIGVVEFQHGNVTDIHFPIIHLNSLSVQRLLRISNNHSKH